ncbi:hypothetical protein BV898_14203 [Hypsibius exemplaris]|uniref:Uncharacterized protein n=1 Tax=Hypsibius exemplaris TaxID=2072580 RepID=A0A1W0W8D8_HYPEX|nr:hypothetical protein BV898_14203 [Hypsibius exemplaris]
MELETLLSIYPKVAPGSKSMSNNRNSPSKTRSASKNDATVLRLIESGNVLPGRDDHVLRAFLDGDSFTLLDACLLRMEYLPEWFLAQCFLTVTEYENVEDKSKDKFAILPSDFLMHLLNRQFDHEKLVKEMRKLSFSSVLAMAKLVLAEINAWTDGYSLEVFAWASALVESHFTEWTVADDSHLTLFRLNEILSDQIESMFLWEDVQGRAKALMDASKTADAALKEDVKYWHSVIEF